MGMCTGLLVLFLKFCVTVALYDQFQQGIESKVRTSTGMFLNAQDRKHRTIQVRNWLNISSLSVSSPVVVRLLVECEFVLFHSFHWRWLAPFIFNVWVCMDLVFRQLKIGLQRILWYLLRMGNCSKFYGEFVRDVFIVNAFSCYWTRICTWLLSCCEFWNWLPSSCWIYLLLEKSWPLLGYVISNSS